MTETDAAGPSAFGSALRALREERDWSQKDLAARTGIRTEQISHYETGHRKWPSVTTLLRISDTCNVSILRLLGRAAP